jgi:signal transduction histidine kinase
MISNLIRSTGKRVRTLILSVPVQVKIIGIGLLPVVILGISLNYWVTTGLSDWLSYIVTDVRVEAAMRAGSRSVIFVSFLSAIISIILAYFFTHLLTRPILGLKRTAEEVAAGNFDSRADVWAHDEIGSLAKSINQMIDNFVDYKDNLTQTNQQLELSNAIAQAAKEHDDIHDALYAILDNIKEYLKFEFGWVYLLDPEVNKHHLASWIGVPDPVKEDLLHRENESLCTCQTELENSELGSTVSLKECARVKLPDQGKENICHLSIPLVVGEMYYGVVNLYFPPSQKLEYETRQFIDTIGTQVSEIVANAWYQIKLREKEAARQVLLDSLVTAQEDERLRLARELHDQTGQTLTNLLIRLKTIERKSEQPGIKDELKEAQYIVSNTIEQVRDISYSLRPPVLEEFGLAAAIQDMISDLADQTDIKVHCNCDLKDIIKPETEMMLYRIAQEGLTNIVRHSEASNVTVDLQEQQQTFYLKIEDDGKGFDPATITVDGENKRLGLLSMNERAELIGGRLNMYSSPGQGTTIEVYVPIH